MVVGTVYLSLRVILLSMVGGGRRGTVQFGWLPAIGYGYNLLTVVSLGRKLSTVADFIDFLLSKRYKKFKVLQNFG